MSNKPSITFNPDYNRLVLDPLTNRLITAGEIARRNAPPAPLVKPVVANPVAAKPVLAPVAKPAAAVAKPVAPVAKSAAPVATPPPAKPAAPLAKPVAPVATPPPAKPAAKEVKFDVSASLNVPVRRCRPPTIVPAKGGYGAVTLGRGRR